MRPPRKSRRSGRLRKFSRLRLLRALRPAPRHQGLGDPTADPWTDLYYCELAAARAAELGGGGSPRYGGMVLGPGEDLALVIEVSRALKEQDQKPWHKVGPYISLS